MKASSDSSDKLTTRGGQEYIRMELYAGDRTKPIGYVEIEYKNDKADGCDKNEWVLFWHKGDDYEEDPEIIAQGHCE